MSEPDDRTGASAHQPAVPHDPAFPPVGAPVRDLLTHVRDICGPDHCTPMLALAHDAYFGLAGQHYAVEGFSADGPWRGTGVEVGDVIEMVDGRPVSDAAYLALWLRSLVTAERTITVSRGGRSVVVRESRIP